ncbi:MAG: FHA domain-containing protein [Planctomycetota bacterium]|jgi:hypothetical protein
MRLVAKQDGRTVKEFRFNKGPIYIGRHVHSHVFLPDRGVSRRHAAIFATHEGKWVVEDLDSANKTLLNGKEIHKAEIKTGDSLRVGSFLIEISLEGDADVTESIHLEDTILPHAPEPSPAATGSPRDVIVRRPDIERAPDITLPAKRAKCFLQATETICKSNGADQMLKALLTIMLRDFSGYRSWGALRNDPEGAMSCHAGKSRDGRSVELSQIQVKEKVTEAIDKKEFLLIPRVSAPTDAEKIRSALIAPIIDPSGCFGVLYVDNKMDHGQYTLSDLDYLMLLAILAAAILENF